MRCMCSKAHKAMIITLVRLFNSEFDLKLSTCAATIHKIVSESIQPILFKTLELQWNFSLVILRFKPFSVLFLLFYFFERPIQLYILIFPSVSIFSHTCIVHCKRFLD